MRDNYRVTIYSYWMHAVASIALNIRLTEFKNIPVRLICRGHRYDLYEDKNYFGYYPDRNRILKQYTYICPCSEDGRKYISKTHPGFESKLQVKRLGTNDKGLANCNNQEPILLISCSTITKVKRLELIVYALHIVQERGYHFKWIHFGDGKDGERIRRICEKQLKSEYYEFRGHVPNDKLLESYRTSRPCLFLNTSASEGVPVSIMEAMSFGIPTVATDVGGTAELIVNQESGFILAPDFKPYQLANAIISVLEMDKASYEKLCHRTRERWNDISNAETIYNAFGHFLLGENV